jgi:hypothetical protein
MQHRVSATKTVRSKGSEGNLFQRRPRFDPKSDHVRLGVDKVAVGQVFTEFFGFPCQFSFHRLLHTHHHLPSGACTIGQIVTDVSSGLSLTPLIKSEEKELHQGKK